LYSLGCTLHHLLTGRPPFEGKNAIQKLQAHKESPPPSLRTARPEVPEWLDRLFQQLMAKKPAERPASAEEVTRRLVSGEPQPWNMTLIIAGGVAVAAVVILVVLLIMKRS
jgi:serine/threonine protein kinase